LAQNAPVSRTIFLAKAVVCCMPWGSTEAAPLCVVTFVAYVTILVAVEALGDYAIAYKRLAVVQLVLPDQPSVYQAISLLWLSDTDDQRPCCTARPKELFGERYSYDFY
jgi:hypothetical protein